MLDATLRELEAILAVGQHRNFRRAARALDLSASALSHAVASLEGRLGVRLFHRTTRSVTLTDAGRRFVDQLAPAIGAISGAMAEATEAQRLPTGTLRINASTAALRFVVRPMATFLETHPGMRLDVIADDRLVDIVAEGFDAGIRLAERVPQDMVAVPCSPDLRFVVVGAPAYLARHGIPRTPAALSAHRCIRRRLANGRLYAWEFERDGETQQVEVAGPFTADHEQAMLDAAIAGVGLCYVRCWAAEDALEAGRLTQVLDEWTPPHAGFRLYYPGHRHVPAGLRALIPLLRSRA